MCHIYEHLQNTYENVVDEAMCTWCDKLRFKVNLKDKPTSYVIKFYELCEANSGYIHRFKIYAADSRISNHLTDTVLWQMNPLLIKEFHLFTNNYYPCPTLYEQLVSRDTMCQAWNGNWFGPREIEIGSVHTGERRAWLLWNGEINVKSTSWHLHTALLLLPM